MLKNVSVVKATPVVMVAAFNGFRVGQRITGQDVEASPPRLYEGVIRSVWSDGTADVKWDAGLTHEGHRHLVRNGYVELHHLRPAV